MAPMEAAGPGRPGSGPVFQSSPHSLADRTNSIPSRSPSASFNAARALSTLIALRRISSTFSTTSAMLTASIPMLDPLSVGRGCRLHGSAPVLRDHPTSYGQRSRASTSCVWLQVEEERGNPKGGCDVCWPECRGHWPRFYDGAAAPSGWPRRRGAIDPCAPRGVTDWCSRCPTGVVALTGARPAGSRGSCLSVSMDHHPVVKVQGACPPVGAHPAGRAHRMDLGEPEESDP